MGEGRPVVFVHGTPGDRNTWRRVAEHRPSGVSAHLVELPGYGQQADGEGGLEVYLDDLEAVLTSLPVPAVLAGLSVGGYLILKILERCSDRVAAVVPCGGILGFTAEEREWRLGMVRALRSGEITTHQAFGELAELLVPPDLREDTILEVIRESYSHDTAARSALAVERLADIGHGAFALLPFDTPAVVVNASADPLVSLARAEAIVALGRNARLEVIDTASHMLPLTHPSRLADIVFGAR